MEATDRPPAGGHTPTLATSFSAIPSAVLRYLATNFLEDAEACRWSQTELGLQSAMTNYVLKAPVPARRWREKAKDDGRGRHFGLPRVLGVDYIDVADASLLTRLDELAPSATRLVLTGHTSAYCYCIPHASTWKLPRGLTSIHTHQSPDLPIASSLPGDRRDWDLSPCIFTLALPNSLTELHLENWMGEDPNQPDAAGRGWTELPPTVTSLRQPISLQWLQSLKSFPPDLVELTNWCWRRSSPPFPSGLRSIQNVRRLQDADAQAAAQAHAPTWPAALTSLSYDIEWAQVDRMPISVWPIGLLDLDLNGAMSTVPLSAMRLPSTLVRLAGIRADQLTPNVRCLPPALQECTFEWSLAHLHLKPSEIIFPATLTAIENLPLFPPGVDLSALVLPAALTRLVLARAESLDALKLPDALRTIRFVVFNQPLTRVRWPTGLTELDLGSSWNWPLSELKLPASLRTLKFGTSFRRAIQPGDIEWPPTLESITFPTITETMLREWQPPVTLTSLTMGAIGQTEDVVLPRMARLTHLRVSGARSLRLPSDRFPSLTRLVFGQAWAVWQWADTVLPAQLEQLEVGHLDTWQSSQLMLPERRLPPTLRLLKLRLDESVEKSIRRDIRASMPHTLAVLFE